MLTKYLVLAVIFYIGICAFMYFRQEMLMFPSRLAPYIKDDNADSFNAIDDTFIETKIMASKNKNAPVVILFTGNAQNALITGEAIWHGFEKKVHLATMNYRSYGNSKGKPTEKNMFSDAMFFTKIIKNKYQNRDIYLMGISLGTGVVSYLASKQSVKGIILMTPFDNIANVAQSKYPILPVKYLIKHHFNSKMHLNGVKTPIAIIRAGQDKVIPKKSTESLAKSLKNIVYDKTLSGMAHTQILNSAHKSMLKEILRAAFKSLKNSKSKI